MNRREDHLLAIFSVYLLLQAGYEVVIVDNLCNSNLECLQRVQQLAGREATFHQVDVRDYAALSEVFAQHSPTAVIHFAGLKAVGESVEQPTKYGPALLLCKVI